MGTDAEATVDLKLRVKGTSNLHLLSTAVFPTAGTATRRLTCRAWVKSWRQRLSGPMDGDHKAAGGVAVIILTHDEEKNLSYAFDSIAPFASEVFVVDSFGTDRTVEIAESRGCAVVSRAFVNQAEQFNWALETLPIRSEWILRLDADESDGCL